MLTKKEGGKVLFDNRVLRGHITESCGSIQSFAERFGISSQAMNLKLSNKASWKREDIIKAVSILGIDDPKEVWRTFFSVESWEITK